MNSLSEKEIQDIEKAIGLPLPDDVKDQFRTSNGLTGPTDCLLLYPYQGPLEYDIVHNNSIRNEEWFPKAFKSVIFIGNDGCVNNVCYDWNTKEAYLWNLADGEYIQERKPTVTEIWAFIEDAYANIP